MRAPGPTTVPLLDVRGASAWLARQGVESVLSGVAEYLRTDLARWPEFDTQPRVASHSPVGVIELMPVSDRETYCFKYVNGHPGNPAAGLQTVTAFGALADVRTGYPTFLAEMTLLTAVRTAATSAVAARALARADASTMALIGAGAQAEFQAAAFRAELGIERLRVFDVDPAASRKFVANAEPLGFDITVASSAADAVRGADVITTCTADKRNAVVLPDELVEPGVHLNALGGDCPGKTELEATTLRRSALFVEFEPQTRIEGELQQLAADSPVTELWRVLTGVAPGRTGDAEITLFDSVGFALEDLSMLRYARDATRGADELAELDLIAAPADPRDLFGLIPAGDSMLGATWERSTYTSSSASTA